MEVMAGFIVGFDNDPDNIFDLQIDFIRKSAVPLSIVSLLAAIPQTQLWRRLEREGRLLGDHTGNNTDCSLNFVPKMDRARLMAGYKSILGTIYTPNEYYQRALDCLDQVNRNGAPELRGTGTTVNDIAALMRIALRLDIQDASRAEFWHFIKRVLAEHREKFGQAIVLAAMGYHFRKLTEQYCGE
jgi:hypothetical protein